MHRRLHALLAAALLVSFAQPAPAQVAREPGSELTVYLATMGPGDLVWEKFGHNAIWIRDATTRTTIAYDYGRFHFGDDFWPRFIRGRMLYSMGLDEADRQLSNYAAYDRSVWLQRLNLTADQKHALREFLEWNWLPQNRDYPYDYFRDNCSTRIRDALDRVLGGAIHAQLGDRPTGTTYRSHSLRLTAASAATYTGLLLGLGLPTDRPIDAWQESFIPMELMRHLRTVQVQAPAGDMVPLVAEEITAYEADRPLPPRQAPTRWPLFLLAGAAAAAGLLLLSHFAHGNRFVRFALASAIFFWGVVIGVFGLILSFLWIFTDHTAAYPNTNLLQTNPLGLVLAVAAPLALLPDGRRRPGARRTALLTAILLSVLGVGGLLLQMFAGARQHSAGIIALALPLHCAVLFALYHAGVGYPSDRDDTATERRDSAAP